MVHITTKWSGLWNAAGAGRPVLRIAMHITAAVYVNDLESGLIEDIGKWLEELAPARPDYKHHRTGEDNGDAHLKSLLLHHETTLPVTDGRLDLGTCSESSMRVRRTAPQAVIVKVRGWSKRENSFNEISDRSHMAVEPMHWPFTY